MIYENKHPRNNTSKGEQILAKQEENGKDLIKIIITKPHEQIKQSDIHTFIEELRRKDFEFNIQYIAVKQKYHDCYDSEIALRVKIGEAQHQNEVVKNTRAEVADKLHPVIMKLRAIVPNVSKRKMAMCLSNVLRDQEGAKEAEQKGISVSNLAAILKIYVAKYGMLFEQETKRGTTQHEGGTLRTFEIKVDDTELLIETFRLFSEAVANGTFSYLNVIIDEHYDLQKFEIVTKSQEK